VDNQNKVLTFFSVKHKRRTRQLAIDFHSIFFPSMKVNFNRQLSGYQNSSKYLLLCSAEETLTGLD